MTAATAPSWQDALPTPPVGGRLQEAWMTSFEQPDAELLVEHLLPSLLGTSHAPSQDLTERTLFFGELGTALEALHGRFSVISSPPRGVREDARYPWLWRYVSHFIVGARANAVQHAKLWAFHWKVGGEDEIELHVSSTNLTTSAFRDQLQAGWRVSRRLGRGEGTRANRDSWGKLIPFIEALGTSAGEAAAERVRRLVALLERAACPAEVAFIASVPGAKSAARQLGEFEPTELHVLTPTIGDWNERTLKAWSDDVGVIPMKIRIKWISARHPWAMMQGWALTHATQARLERSGVGLECLANDDTLVKEHREADPRWSHAKLYLLRSRRRTRQLLVTSANWSAAAWGAGRSTPRNFELGVIFETDWTALEALGEDFDPPETVPYCVDRCDADERASPLAWAEASWDGKVIRLRARSSDTKTPITASVAFIGAADKDASLSDGTGSIRWKDPERTPLTASFEQGGEVLEVDVVDVRPPDELVKTPLPEVDPATATALREAFLLQRYGGPAADPEAIAGLGVERRVAEPGAPLPDYSVQAWIDARAAFSVVDRWRSALAESTGDAALVARVRLDGEGLRALFARRDGPASELVVEELGWHLDERA